MDDKKIRKIYEIHKNKFNYFKLYHELPYLEELPSYRKNTLVRVEALIKLFDVKEKRGLDIGMGNGGITFGLQMAGAQMLGMTGDKREIEFAKVVEKEFQTGAEFLHSYVTEGWAENLDSYDFILWFSSFQYVPRQIGSWERAKQILKIISTKTNLMFFECPKYVHMPEAGKGEYELKIDVSEMLKLNTNYQIENLGVVDSDWHNRVVFKCFREEK